MLVFVRNTIWSCVKPAVTYKLCSYVSTIVVVFTASQQSLLHEHTYTTRRFLTRSMLSNYIGKAIEEFVCAFFIFVRLLASVVHAETRFDFTDLAEPKQSKCLSGSSSGPITVPVSRRMLFAHWIKTPKKLM